MEITREQATAALVGLEKMIKTAGAQQISKTSACCAAIALIKDSDKQALRENYYIAATYMAEHPEEYLSMQIAQRLGSASYLAVIAQCPTDFWEKMPKSTALKAWTLSWAGKGDPLIDLALSADIVLRSIAHLSENFGNAYESASEEAKHHVGVMVAQLASEGSEDGAQLHSMLQTFNNQNIIVDFAHLLVQYQAFQRHLLKVYPNSETRPEGFEAINKVGGALVGDCANLITLFGVLGTSSAVEGHNSAKKEVDEAINKWAKSYDFKAPALLFVCTPEHVQSAEQYVDSRIRELKGATNAEDTNAIVKAKAALSDALCFLHVRRSNSGKVQTKDEAVKDAKQRADEVLTGDLRACLNAGLELVKWLGSKVDTVEAKTQCAGQALVVEKNMAVLDNTQKGEFITTKKKDIDPLVKKFSSSIANELKNASKIKQ